MVTSQQKEGKRNRIKVIGDVKGRKRKRNSATNIPSKPASVTNAIQRGTKNERSTLRMTLVAQNTGRALASCDFESYESTIRQTEIHQP